jgi:hypothetical protein
MKALTSVSDSAMLTAKSDQPEFEVEVCGQNFELRADAANGKLQINGRSARHSIQVTMHILRTQGPTSSQGTAFIRANEIRALGVVLCGITARVPGLASATI